MKHEDPVLNSDGTVSSEMFPETKSWSDIVDIRCGYNLNQCIFIIGLTSTGKVLSAGIDFTAENVVKIQVYDEIPCDIIVAAALTADGKLVFSKVPKPEAADAFGLSMYDVVQQAKEFTDVEDFIIFSAGNADADAVILVKKKDCTLHATTNSYYNPELVQSP